MSTIKVADKPTLDTVNTNVNRVVNKLPSSNIADKSTLDTIDSNVTYIKDNMPSGGGDTEITDGSIKIDNGLWLATAGGSYLQPICTLPNVFCTYSVRNTSSTNTSITLKFSGNLSLPSTASSYEYVYVFANTNATSANCSVQYLYKCFEDLDGAPFGFFAPSFKAIVTPRYMGPDSTNNFSHWNTSDLSYYLASSITGSNRYTKVTISGSSATIQTRNGSGFYNAGATAWVACKLK